MKNQFSVMSYSLVAAMVVAAPESRAQDYIPALGLCEFTGASVATPCSNVRIS
jgi:hypothetical protein